MKYILLIFLLLISQSFTSSKFNVYFCKKCKNQTTSQYTPNTIDCPGGGSHTWTNLGQSGSNTYLCSKCNTKVNTKNTPNTIDCPKGSHNWVKL